MTRVLLAGFAGAVVYFVWQMLAWMAIPVHGPTVKALPDEAAVVEALKAQNLETGVYVVPWADGESLDDPEFLRRHEAGPLFSIYYTAEGAAPMSMGTLLGGFIIDLLATLIVACMLTAAVGGCCCNGYWSRVGFVLGFGVFLALTGHISYLNWMRFPLDYTIGFIVDAVVGWFLVGLVVGAIVKPASNCPTEKDAVKGADA